MMNVYYKEKYKLGLEFQDFLSSHLPCLNVLNNVGIQKLTFYNRQSEQHFGETKEGVEVKLNSKCGKKGWKKNPNLILGVWIEIAEKSDSKNTYWIPSGIDKDDNTKYYIMGNQDLYFFFERSVLQECRKQKLNKIRTIDNGTSQGFALSISESYNYCFAYVKNNKSHWKGLND